MWSVCWDRGGGGGEGSGPRARPRWRLRCRYRRTGWRLQSSSSSSADGADAESAETGSGQLLGEHLLTPLVLQIQVAGAGEPDIADGQHPHREIDSGPDRLQRGVERLFSDGDLGESYRDHPVAAPHEQGKRSLHWSDLEDAGLG